MMISVTGETGVSICPFFDEDNHLMDKKDNDPIFVYS